jgi:methylthioribose-1-phosphate isomerase
MRTVEWRESRVRLIDQRQLPWALAYAEYDDYRDLAQAITDGVVRGAQAVGVAAAFGMALAAQQSTALDIGSTLEFLDVAAVILKKSHAPAAYLIQCVDRMLRTGRDESLANVREIKAAMFAEAQKIADEDAAANQKISAVGLRLIKSGDTILLHADMGTLAAVEYGTGVGMVRAAIAGGRRVKVLVTESRPGLQGARLTAWELSDCGVPFEVIPDSAAGYFMHRRQVDLVLVGAYRVAANGDVINRIGSYPLAVLARENRVPFYAVAPLSAFDPRLPTGESATLDEGSPSEVREPYGNTLMPPQFPVRNPQFDIIPQRYLAGIVTEGGLLLPPFRETLERAANGNTTGNAINTGGTQAKP